MGEALEAVSEALEYEGVRARSIELRRDSATEDSTVVVLRASRDFREAGGESSSTLRLCAWWALWVDEVGVWELEASASRSFSLSLLLSLIEEKKFLKTSPLGGLALVSAAGSSTLFWDCFEPADGFVPIGAR